MPAYSGTARAISSRICCEEWKRTAAARSGRTRAATSPKTSHSGLLDPMRGPGTGYARTGAGMKHFGWVKGETVLQVHGTGPWVIEYLNPDDDPRKKK